MRCALNKKRFKAAFDLLESSSYDATLKEEQLQSPEEQLFFDALNLDSEEALADWSMEDLVTAFNAYPKYMDKLRSDSEMLEHFSAIQAKMNSITTEYKKRRVL